MWRAHWLFWETMYSNKRQIIREQAKLKASEKLLEFDVAIFVNKLKSILKTRPSKMEYFRKANIIKNDLVAKYGTEITRMIDPTIVSTFDRFAKFLS